METKLENKADDQSTLASRHMSRRAAESEAALRLSLARFDQLVEQSHTLIWEVDTNGLFTAVNQTIPTITGYTPEELIGKKHFYDLHPAEGRDAFKQTSLRTMTSQRPFYNLENPIETRRGTIIWVSSNGIPLFDEQGNFSGYWGIDLDITKRKQAESVLQESERRYRLLAENTTDVIWTMDLNLQTTYTSPSVMRLRGFDPATAMTQPLADMLTPASLALASQALLEELAKERLPEKDLSRSRMLELEIIRKDGSIVPTETTVTFLRDEEGRLREILGVTRDISERKRVEDALRQSQEAATRNSRQLQSILESPQGMIIFALDTEYRYTAFTHAHFETMKAIWGTEIEVGMNMLDVILSPVDRHKAQRNFDRALQGNYFIEVEQYGDPTLKRTVYEDRYSPIFTEEGVVAGLTVFVTDITERQWAEEQIRQSHETYKGLIDSVTESIYVQDEQGVFLDVNETAVSSYGIPREQIIGRTPEIFSAEGKNDLDQLAILHRKAFNGEPQIFEFWGRRGDGSIFPKEVTISPGVYFGQKVVIAVSRDITERKKADKQIQYESDLRELLVELSTNFINLPLNDLEPAIQRSLAELGQFANADRAYLFAYDLISQTASNTYEWCAEGIEAQLDNLQNLSMAHIPDWVEKHQKGEPFYVPDVQALPDEGPESLRGLLEPQGIKSLITLPMISNGRLLGFVGFDSVRQYRHYAGYEQQLLQLYAQMLVNVMERQQAEQQIKQAQEDLARLQKLESIGTLAGGIAHDFNNLLLGLFGNMALAQLHLEPNHPAAKPLERAQQAMDRATRLTQQLLTFARGGDPILEMSNMGALVQEAVTFDLSGSNVQSLITCAADLWPANVDKGQIQQVVANLVINARQAMPVGGKLYVSLQNAELGEEVAAHLPADRYVQITIRDEGTGIDPKHIERIFDPYFTTKQAGSGLGLATTHSIIRKHGGYISVTSELGQGTTFILYLPAAAVAPDPKASLREMEPAPAIHPARILVMDDEEILRSAVAELLEYKGFEVETAADGRAAIAAYEQGIKEKRPFTAVIMDITIPGGMGGKETVRAILDIDPQARCIVSSGYDADPIMANYADYGFKGVVKKPYNLHQLLEIMMQIIRN